MEKESIIKENCHAYMVYTSSTNHICTGAPYIILHFKSVHILYALYYASVANM